MFGGLLAGVGTRNDTGDTHFAHVPLDQLAIEPQRHGNLARAVERILRVQLVDAPLDDQLCGAG